MKILRVSDFSPEIFFIDHFTLTVRENFRCIFDLWKILDTLSIYERSFVQAPGYFSLFSNNEINGYILPFLLSSHYAT